MKRQLPTHSIHGTEFMVDVDKGELIQTDDPDNIIWFGNLNDKGDHYEMCYDLRDKNWVTPVGPMNDNTVDVTIPLMSALDPEGMAIKYGDPTVYLKGMTEQQYIHGLAMLADRHNGELPKVIISLDAFQVDVAHHRLVHTEEPGLTIDLKKMDLSDDGETYKGFYSSQKSQLVEIDPCITALPEWIFLIEFPNELRLDPVGAARLYGLDEKDVLARYPVQQNRHAKLTPLSETGLPALIAQNLKKQEQRQAQKPQNKLKSRI
jgi:hypothetical protein